MPSTRKETAWEAEIFSSLDLGRNCELVLNTGLVGWILLGDLVQFIGKHFWSGQYMIDHVTSLLYFAFAQKQSAWYKA